MKSGKVLFIPIIALLIIAPVLGADIAIDDANATDNAWYWYNKAVDLATAGKYSEALAANEKALARNQEFELAWANEAGILVQLGRYNDAIRAADNVLTTNRTGLPMKYTFAAAYYSKGDALLALGNISGAQDCYSKAHDLDPTLIPPDLSAIALPATTGAPSAAVIGSSPVNTIQAGPTVTRSPVSLVAGIGALLGGMFLVRYRRAE